MGGSKKPAPAKQDKGRERKGRKDKPESGPKRAEITVRVDEEQAMRIVRGAKVVTMHELARQTGVKISAANAFLRRLRAEGAVTTVGGRAGHYLYQSVQQGRGPDKERQDPGPGKEARQDAGPGAGAGRQDPRSGADAGRQGAASGGAEAQHVPGAGAV